MGTEFKNPSRTSFLRTDRMNQRKLEMVTKRNKFTDDSRHPSHCLLFVYLVSPLMERMPRFPFQIFSWTLNGFLPVFLLKRTRKGGGRHHLAFSPQSSILLDGIGLNIVQKTGRKIKEKRRAPVC